MRVVRTFLLAVALLSCLSFADPSADEPVAAVVVEPVVDAQPAASANAFEERLLTVEAGVTDLQKMAISSRDLTAIQQALSADIDKVKSDVEAIPDSTGLNDRVAELENVEAPVDLTARVVALESVEAAVDLTARVVALESVEAAVDLTSRVVALESVEAAVDLTSRVVALESTEAPVDLSERVVKLESAEPVKIDLDAGLKSRDEQANKVSASVDELLVTVAELSASNVKLAAQLEALTNKVDALEASSASSSFSFAGIFDTASHKFNDLLVKINAKQGFDQAVVFVSEKSATTVEFAKAQYAQYSPVVKKHLQSFYAQTLVLVASSEAGLGAFLKSQDALKAHVSESQVDFIAKFLVNSAVGLVLLFVPFFLLKCLKSMCCRRKKKAPKFVAKVRSQQAK